MDNTLVSARLSRAKKERGCGVLAEIGATTSDLINRAFDYVIANGELPGEEKTTTPSAEDFAAFVKESTLEVNWPESFDGDYRELQSHLRMADYEALA